MYQTSRFENIVKESDSNKQEAPECDPSKDFWPDTRKLLHPFLFKVSLKDSIFCIWSIANKKSIVVTFYERDYRRPRALNRNVVLQPRSYNVTGDG